MGDGNQIMVPRWMRDGLRAYLDAGGELDEELVEAVCMAMADVYAGLL